MPKKQRSSIHSSKTNGSINCPYEWEIIDGKLYIDGEDFGEADSVFEEGVKLRKIVKLWHEVSSANM